MNKIVITSGHFDPLHVGHIEYLNLARKLGDFLLVIVNNDKCCLRKKGKIFMPQQDRIELIRNLKPVDMVVLQIDQDNTVKETLKEVSNTFNNGDFVFNLIFAKGGDRFAYEIPESDICKKYNIEIIDGVGDKIRSSSEILKSVEA